MTSQLIDMGALGSANIPGAPRQGSDKHALVRLLAGVKDAQVLSVLRAFACIVGCDYVPKGVPGMGAVAAVVALQHAVAGAGGSPLSYQHISGYLKQRVPASFMKDFARAQNCFLHQWIFDMSSAKFTVAGLGGGSASGGSGTDLVDASPASASTSSGRSRASAVSTGSRRRSSSASKMSRAWPSVLPAC